MFTIDEQVAALVCLCVDVCWLHLGSGRIARLQVQQREAHYPSYMILSCGVTPCYDRCHATIGAILHRMPSYVGLDRGRLAFIGGCTAGVHNVVMHDLCATRRDSIAVGVKALQFDGVLPTPGSAQSCWTFVLQNSPSQLKQASLAKAPQLSTKSVHNVLCASWVCCCTGL